VSRHLNLADGLHEGVPDDDADICPRVAFCLGAQGHKVGVHQGGRGGAQVQPEHEGAGVRLRQRYVNTLLKPATHHSTNYITWAFAWALTIRVGYRFDFSDTGAKTILLKRYRFLNGA